MEMVLVSFAVAFSATWVACLILVLTTKRIRKWLPDRNDAKAIQASHVGEPLRFGGLVIFMGVCFGAWMLSDMSEGTLSLSLIASSVPVLVAGALEDAGFNVSARKRLVAALISAGAAVFLFGYWVSRADIPIVDVLLSVAPIAIAATILVAAGFCHALNLVDGMNGLASVNIVGISAGLAVFGWGAGFGQIAVIASLIALSTSAFLTFNWPFGKLFLGDAGSYTIGHLLIWLAMSLVVLDDTIAVGAVLLILFWPIMDMLHSMARRLLKGVPVFSPDRLHFHQIVRRGLEVLWLGCGNRRRSNPLATVVMIPFIITPIICAIMLQHNPYASWIVFLLFAALYSFVHTRMIVLVRLYRARLGKTAVYDKFAEADNS